MEAEKTYWKMPKPTVKQPLVIKPTCASCGLIAGIDCQRTCEYVFGLADVNTSLPQEIAFNEDHQFSLSVPVYEEGKNFGKQKPKTCWFNSVRCAELFLILHGHAKGTRHDSTPIGNGERLLMFLGGPEIVKARNRRSLEYKQAQMQKRITNVLPTGSEPIPAH